MTDLFDIDGAELLDEVYEFLGRFVAYPSDAAHIAHTLWIAHTYFMDDWDSTPRIAFLSPEPGSGKSRALEVTEPLVDRPTHAVNTSPAYLFRKVSDDAGLPVILYDEIDTVFGPKAKDNEDIRGMLNAGHRKGAVAGRCVVRGANVQTEELPAYCAVALAGLDDLPDTINSRSIVVRMRRRAPGETVEPWRNRKNAPEGEAIREKLRQWAAAFTEPVEWPDMPDGIEDRDADVWESLLTVASMAGENWPERANCAAVTLVTDKSEATLSIGVRLLSDIRDAFDHHGVDTLWTAELLRLLLKNDDAPWGDLKGGELNSRGLAQRLRKYDIHPGTVRIHEETSKGYKRKDFEDAWSRYVPVSATGPGTNTEEEIYREEESKEQATGVPSDSADTSVTTSHCEVCDKPLHAAMVKRGITRCMDHAA